MGEPCPGAPASAAGPAAPAPAGPWATRPAGHAHTAGRHPQPTAGDLPEFVCLVSGCDRAQAPFPSPAGSLVFEKLGKQLIITAPVFGSPITQLFAYPICQEGFEDACGNNTGLDRKVEARAGKRMLSRLLYLEPGVGALNGVVSSLAAEAKGDIESPSKFSQLGQRERIDLSGARGEVFSS